MMISGNPKGVTLTEEQRAEFRKAWDELFQREFFHCE